MSCAHTGDAYCGVCQPNDVILRMRRIYCTKGAAFAGPELKAGWEEIIANRNRIAELEAEVDRLNEMCRHYGSVMTKYTGNACNCLTESRRPKDHAQFCPVSKMPVKTSMSNETKPRGVAAYPKCAGVNHLRKELDSYKAEQEGER